MGGEEDAVGALILLAEAEMEPFFFRTLLS
jgi:hypothetical protein